MLRPGLTKELKWFAFLLSLTIASGIGFGQLSQFLIVFLFGYVCRLMYSLARLESWVIRVRHGGSHEHNFSGIWGEICDEISRITKIYQKDKRRMQAVVRRVQDMTSALEDGAVLLDKLANVEWWNESAQVLFGFREVDKGHRIENIIRHPEFVKYFEAQEYSDPLELVALRREDQYLEFRIHPFGEGERLVVVRDITRIKKLEQMRKDFVGNVSHELRTPLTVIRGYIETMEDMPNLPAPLEKALGQMNQQGQRMTNLISDLITLTRLETDNIDNTQETVPLAPMIDTIFSDAQALDTPYEYSLLRTGAEDLSLIGNGNQLRSALSNLILNAIKYANKTCCVEVNITVTDEECEINVIDNGSGIDVKHLPRLTERFYRVDDGRSAKMGGTGLGLAIVKHVLFRHDGQLRIQSQVGVGSTFTCCFPIHRVSPTPTPA